MLLNLEGCTFDSQGLGQRGIGDILEDRVKFEYRNIANRVGMKWSDAPTVRSIQDFSIETDHVIHYDVKTTDLDRSFSMPNLISAKRLSRLYADPNAELRYVLVSYREVGGKKTVIKYEERNIETIPWSHLCIQNLGEGQIQLIPSESIPHYTGTREEWMAELKRQMITYLDRTIEKMRKRKEYWSN
jgi:hypothetical protein